MPTQRNDRLKIAQIAASVLVPIVRARGTWHEPTIRCPAFFSLDYAGFQFFFTGPVQLMPVVPRKSWLFDVYSGGIGKVLSVRWPPFELVSFRTGDWLDRLDLLVRMVCPEVPEDWRFRRSRTAGSDAPNERQQIRSMNSPGA